MKLEIEISDKELMEFGKEAIEQEVKDSIRRRRLRAAFIQLSQEICANWDADEYDKQVELARKEAWEIYREEIGL